MTSHDPFDSSADDGVPDWVADEVDAAWDDDLPGLPDVDTGDDGADVSWTVDGVDDDAGAPSLSLDGDLDGDGDVDVDDLLSASDDVSVPTIDLPGDDPVADDAGPAEPFDSDSPTVVFDDVDPVGIVDAGFTHVDTLADVASWLAPDDADAGVMRDELDRLVSDDDGPGVDARTAVQLFGRVGVDALVAHGNLDDLADTLDAGGRVVIAGEDGSRLEVVAVDFQADTLVVRDDGGTRTLALDDFEDAWSAGANEMVVASAEDSAVTVLPISLGDVS